jgi:hypothetical integral membrane protein (TIGR02206 family)
VRQFSDQHIAALTVMVLTTAVSVWAARRHPGRWIGWFSRGLALLILAAWAGEYVADVILGQWSVQYTLPFQLTDAVSLTAALALWTRRPLLVELVYFWTFTASLQAVITPDLAWSFPSALYFTYFGYHIGAIVAAAFLVFGCRLYPRPGAVWRVYAATLAWAAIAGAADVITGGNYMYISHKPVHASLLNALGPWPWYIAVSVVVGLFLFGLVAALTRGVQTLIDPDVRIAA